MRITLAQLNPIIGDLAGNIKQIQNILAKNPATDLIIFPELFLTGYPPKDLLEKKSFTDQCQKGIKEIRKLSAKYKNIGLLLGAPLINADPFGKPLFNSAVLFFNGKIIFTQHKRLLPSYDVFDESRYFEPALTTRAIAFKNEVLGITICEDIWNISKDNSPRKLYKINPLEILVQKGATIIINLSASPYNLSKETERYNLITEHVKRLKLPFVYVNQVGANDELIFDGQSFCFNSRADLIAQLKPFEPEVKTINLTNAKSLKLNTLPKMESLYQALVLGIKDYFAKCGFKKAVLGLSGGIDSALTAVLAVEALGAKNVLGITMPSKFSSEGSIKDSEKLAKNLGVECKIIPIAKTMHAYEKTLGPYFAKTKPGLAEENLQARIRGNILMAFSNKFGYMVLSTGNKSELAVGYCTLYGDMSGGLAVISDVPKITVYELAKYINRKKEIIPKNTITKVPSAELRPNQTDQDTLPEYAILDQILYSYIDLGLSAKEIEKQGFKKDTIDWVINTLNKSEYKRRQAAPGLKVTAKAFGSGRRLPIASKITV